MYDPVLDYWSIISSLILPNKEKCCSGDNLEATLYQCFFWGLNVLALCLFNNGFWESAQVDRILGSFTSSLHGLRISWAHSLPQDALKNVASHPIVPTALRSGGWAMTSADDCLKLELFINKARVTLLPIKQPLRQCLMQLLGVCEQLSQSLTLDPQLQTPRKR